MIYENIRTHLLTVSDLTDLIGTRLYGGRILPVNVKYPCTNYFTVTYLERHEVDLKYPTIQFSTRSNKSFDEAWTITEVIISELKRYKGDLGGKKINQVVFLDANEIYEPDTKKYHVPADFKFIYIDR